MAADLVAEGALAADLVAEGAQDLTEDLEKCTKQPVETAARIVKYHSSQDRTNQSTAMNVSRIINQQETKKDYTTITSFTN